MSTLGGSSQPLSTASEPSLRAREGVLLYCARGAGVLLAYAALAVVLTWPLALHLRTYLPGDPSGDTGVYVWNLWIFRHELVAHGHLPFSTRHIFGFTGGSDFALHNYTPTANLLAMPLIPALGIVGAFNVVLMAAIALSAAATYLLARHLGLGRWPAWITGAAFVAMPLLSAREMAHLSLVITGALPLFVWALMRAIERPSVWRGVGIGAIVALATYSDAYYGIYCVLMGLVILAARFVRIGRHERGAGAQRVRSALGIAAALIGAAAAAGIASGMRDLRIGALQIHGLDEPYAPAMVVAVFWVLRFLLRHRYSAGIVDRSTLDRLVRTGGVAVATCLALLVPPIVGIAQRFTSGRIPDTGVLWRSSPRGVDALAYLVPNPVHAWAGQWTGRWLLPPVEDAFPELVASCSLVMIGLVAIAAFRRQVPRFWVAFTLVFAVLSLGPFVHVAGINTFLPGPWALLRYVPVIGMARSPSRFAIVAALGLAILFGFALDRLQAGRHGRRRLAVAVVAMLAIELIPAPRQLFSAAVPDIYQYVTEQRDDRGSLLELPTGVRDGTSSVGAFSARTAYFQTRHGRPVLGGYLSRVSERRRQDNLRSPVMRGLFALSEPDGRIDAAEQEAARRNAGTFLARSCVRYVMIDTERASPALRSFAIETLGLVQVHADTRFELLVPEAAPECR